ncbi:hypothetical protein BOTCAL_0045g00030 [Botryotinia calthae]|uniref:Uncharacterized protein n=1 Tax=Botryotinia calthae TaxID=38488 RepID=A0A4Y8DCA0_9HELO|nr:hypothetical protein BOTCAL_0045g00030 [Botryotinia calthae]
MPGQTSEIILEDFQNPLKIIYSPSRLFFKDVDAFPFGPENTSSLQFSSSAKSAKSQRIAVSHIHCYLQDPYTSVPYATIVNNPQASVHKQLNRVAAAGYRMGTMLKEFDEAFDGNTSGGNNDSNDQIITGS